MNPRFAFDWVWIALISFASSAAGLAAVWFLVIVPQLLDPHAEMRRSEERTYLVEQFRQELDRSAQSLLSRHEAKIEAATKQLDTVMLQRFDQSIERATKQQLSDAFLAELRGQVLEQAQQVVGKSGNTSVAPKLAATVVEEMLREDLSAASSARLAVSESWLSNGKPPSSNSEAGIPDGPSFNGKVTRLLVIGPGGTITVHVDPRIGTRDAKLVWIPKLRADRAGIDFNCATNIPAVLTVIPLCELQANPGE